MSMIKVFVLHLCTTFKVRMPSRSEDIPLRIDRDQCELRIAAAGSHQHAGQVATDDKLAAATQMAAPPIFCSTRRSATLPANQCPNARRETYRHSHGTDFITTVHCVAPFDEA